MNYTSNNISPSLIITGLKTIGLSIPPIVIMLVLRVLHLKVHAKSSELSFEQIYSSGYE
jgi:hypothetical protein